MTLEYTKIAVTIFLAVIGFIIGHYFNSRRDKLLKRRELTTEYLINAYRVLANEISHREETIDRDKILENIISDIQLFGNPKQVILAQKLANDVATGGIFELDPLINELRKTLRNELGLDPVEGNVKWLRLKKSR